MTKQHSDKFSEPVMNHVRTDFPLLRKEFTVQQALDLIRREGLGERIIYFYVVDKSKRLLGVLPTRRLLISPVDTPLSELMIAAVVALPDTATVLEACEWFVLYKFLAIPVVDAERRIRGVAEVGLFTEELLNFEERERVGELFETIGFRVSELREASSLMAFRFRFPWLLATILSGTVCALLAAAYEATLAQSLVLAFFLTLVLGLGESVTAQSMTVTVQALRARRPSGGWYAKALRRELGTAALLGVSCGLLVAAVVALWRGPGLPAVVIGGSIALSLVTACVVGLSVPAALHALKLDPKIAAGPVSLALADVLTLLFYFNLGHLLLGQA